MTLRIKQFYYVAFIALVFSLNYSVDAQNRAYRVNDRQVQTLLNRIESRTNTFRETVYKALDSSSINGSNREDSLNAYVRDFENATDDLKNNFSNRRSTTNDVQEVLNRGAFINNFLRNNQISRPTQNQWNLIRTDLNTLANYYRVSWNWNNNQNNPTQTRPYYVTDNQLKTLLMRIEQRGNTFRRDLDNWLDRSRLNGSKREDNFNDYASQFENATDKLRQNFDERDSVSTDVEEVLRSGSTINSFVNNLRLSNSLENQWNQIRSDLTTLANYYRVSWNWNNQNLPSNSYNSFDSRLTGTYRLNSGQSDNVANTIRNSISNINYNPDQRERTQRNLERRLVSSETIMLEKRGTEVTLASTNVPQVSFSADGTARSETNSDGRTTKVRASSTNNELTIIYEGDRMNDFNVSFIPMNNGQLKISRRVFLENRNQTVTVNSIYDKIDQVPRWNSNTSNNSNNSNNTDTNNFLIPNNTRLTATLDNQLSTKTAKDSDRFTMTIKSPSQYDGAIIEGRVIGEKSGVVSGRATLSLSFETIRLRNGNTFRFAGIVEQVRQPNGNLIYVNNEGTVQDSSQTTKTVTRAGIGAILGAIIGAVVDGGQGAVIGAGIGAGAGAGSVVLQGRDNLDLPSGTEFTITATAPNNVANNR